MILYLTLLLILALFPRSSLIPRLASGLFLGIGVLIIMLSSIQIIGLIVGVLWLLPGLVFFLRSPMQPRLIEHELT